MPRLQQGGDIVGLILNPLEVVRPFWGKEMVPNPLPVEMQLIESESGNVNHRAMNLLGSNGELLSEQARLGQLSVLLAGVGNSNPVGPPVCLVEEPH